MLRIVARNNQLQQVIELFSKNFTDKFLKFVDENRVIHSHRFSAKHFIFWYRFIEERNLIVITAFKTRNTNDEMNFGLSYENQREINRIYNRYLDTDKRIE